MTKQKAKFRKYYWAVLIVMSSGRRPILKTSKKEAIRTSQFYGNAPIIKVQIKEVE